MNELSNVLGCGIFIGALVTSTSWIVCTTVEYNARKRRIELDDKEAETYKKLGYAWKPGEWVKEEK